MMHINLWLVQFDAQNKEQYYRNVVSLGEELERNNGAYSLLDINRSSVISQEDRTKACLRLHRI